jgi:cytochrome oxidase Cu insertion factor (SCO1/SenC/PrrC family)
MMPARTRLAVIVATVLVGVGLGYIAHRLFTGASPIAVVREGRSFGEALVGGPFSLVDQDGKRRTDAEFRGRLMLVDFGFTNCPDICPLGLALMADALDRLGPQANNVQPIFITVDPARDTPPVIKDYVAHFSDRMIGLTGTPEEIAAAAKAYRVYYKVHGDPATNPNYAVDHSGFIYLMGRDGKFLTHFMHDTPPDRVADAIRRYL